MKKNLLLFFALLISKLFANAQTEIEPNNSFGTANALIIGDTITGSIDGSDLDYFVVQMPSSGIVSFSISGISINIAYSLIAYSDSSANSVIHAISASMASPDILQILGCSNSVIYLLVDQTGGGTLGNYIIKHISFSRYYGV